MAVKLHILFCTVFAVAFQAVAALVIPEGDVYNDPDYMIISEAENGNQLSVGGTLNVNGLLVGNNSYFSEAEVEGEVNAGSVYVGGGSRGCKLLVKNGGVMRADSLRLYGDATTGIPYSELRNSISVTGSGSLLDISGHLNIWSPDAPGEVGQYGIPREIPAYLQVGSGAEVSVDTVSVENGSWIAVREGGRFTVRSDLDVSEERMSLMIGSTLTVEGHLRGLTSIEKGRRVNASSVLGNMNVRGLLSGTGTDHISVEGDLSISEDGTLELSARETLHVSGDVQLGGVLTVLMDDDATVHEFGDRVQLFEIGGNVSGSFKRVDLISSGTSLQWDASELSATGAVYAIPEPSTIALMGLAGAMLFSVRKHTAHH